MTRSVVQWVQGNRSQAYFYLVTCTLAAATLLLMWSGYRATREWRRGTRMLVEQHTAEVVQLAVLAISRDMRGMQSQALPNLGALALQPGSLYDLADEVGVAFGRYPYPESFFSGEFASGRFHVFSRTDRPPPWFDPAPLDSDFPIITLESPQKLEGVIDLLRAEASLLTNFVVFETEIAGHPYQVIARLRYGAPSQTSLQGAYGFLVNLNWVRAYYFPELIAELSNILSGERELALTILDDTAGAVATTGPLRDAAAESRFPAREQRFPLLFFDPVLRASVPEGSLPLRYWTVRADAFEDPSVRAGAGGFLGMFVLISVAAVAAAIALVLTGRAIRSAAALANMKSEFASAVTHELKVPLSSIRLASETLARGRLRTPQAASEYAAIMLREVSRLTRSVDNLLAVARVDKAEDLYILEAVDLAAVLEEVVSRFRTQLDDGGFEVRVAVPQSVRPVRADRAAILQVLENVVDNAIRYSGPRRRLDIRASEDADGVALSIRDSGPGIPPDELPHVFDKFFRGRNLPSGGSGLGLSIAKRVMDDHGGTIRVSSTKDGTRVDLSLPFAGVESQG